MKAKLKITGKYYFPQYNDEPIVEIFHLEVPYRPWHSQEELLQATELFDTMAENIVAIYAKLNWNSDEFIGYNTEYTIEEIKEN